MPIRHFPLQEVSANVVDRVARQVIEGVLAGLGVRSLFDRSLYVTTDYMGATLSDDGNGKANIARDRCDVKVEDVVNPSLTKWPMQGFQFNQAYGITNATKLSPFPLFCDPTADVVVVEQLAPCSVRLNFELSFMNREDAYVALDALINRYDNAGTPYAHDVAYVFPIDMGLATALMTIYKLRRTLPAGTTYAQYVQLGSNYSIGAEVLRDDLARKAGDDAERQIVAKRQVLSCLGMMTFDQERPEMEADGGGTPQRFILRFVYDVQFQRPVGLRMHFPVVVENQLVPATMIPTTPPSETIRGLEGALQERSFTTYLRANQRKPPVMLVRFPEYDDWVTPASALLRFSFHPFFIAGVLLDTPQPTTVDFQALGEITLHPVVVKLMKKHGRDLFDVHGLFHVAVFVNNTPLDPSRLSISDDLVLTIDAADPTKRYHMVLAEATDLRWLDPKWWQELLENRTFFPATIIQNLNHLIDRGYYTIQPSDDLLEIITRCMQAGTLDGFIQQLITAGHCGREIWQYTASAFQFADYISNTPSKLTPTRWLFDEIAALGLAAGCIDHIPGRYVRTPDGYPIGIGGVNVVNSPLRILHNTIYATR